MDNERTATRLHFTGLWSGTTKDGDSFLSGKVNPMLRLVVWQNKFKDPDKNPRAPDFVAYLYSNGQGRTSSTEGEHVEGVHEESTP